MQEQVKIMTITPEIAESLLKKNVGNRNLNKRNVDSLAHQMSKGIFRFNGDPIRMNGDRLLDGQHRLTAIIKSGLPQRMLVVSGLDDECFATIDTGKKRTASDVLGASGIKYSSKLPAACQMINVYKMTRRFMTHRHELSLNNEQVCDYVEAHPELIDYAHEYKHRFKHMLPCSAYITMRLFTQRADDSLAVTFWDKFETGADLEIDSPILALRNHLNRLNRAEGIVLGGAHATAIAKSWTAFKKGRSMLLLRVTGTEEVVIEGLVDDGTW